MIPVTKTFLPPLELYQEYVQRAFNNSWLTNRGELVLELEKKLKELLGVSNIIITNNGTVPIQIALKLLGRGGEVITTPFSYVATTSSIVWENCTPVFVDIHPEYLTIDESKIEAAITEKTTCILATHVYGNPCNVDAIAKIAKQYGLKVIYDAAHAFGIRFNGQSIFQFGDVSTCSFHATKIFHTAEGGAIFCNDQDLYQRLYYHHNFGHNGPLEFHGLGINGKISELQAAMGLAVLPFMDEIIEKRKSVVEAYRSLIDQSKVTLLKIRPGTEWNNSYFPIIFKSEKDLLNAQVELNSNNIFPRRYFYPSLNKLPYVHAPAMPVSEHIAERVMCLPLYVGLLTDDIHRIANIINQHG
ncbi:MAG: DegT/DnrJ/EryC1/StrS family aminotransferase [Bacteroidota bacterium]|jgi:dTDP-4-amino-4,6-dideoxygalactose transaminase